MCARFAEQAAAHGVGAVALQMLPKNDRFHFILGQALRPYGIKCGTWETDARIGGATLSRSMGADFHVDEAERPEDWRPIFAEYPPGYPVALAGNFNDFQPLPDGTPDDEIDLLRARPYMAECYLPENPQATPANVLDYALRVLGHPGEVHALIGVYAHDNTGRAHVPFSRYVEDPVLAAFDRVWVWLAETMKPEDWTAMKAWSRA